MPNIKAVFDDPRTTSRNPATLAKRAGVSIKAATAPGRRANSAACRKAAQRKEALNLSPAENAAALAAPARPRSERAKKIDYAKLAKGKA
jgi:hypothetical protein